MRMLNLVDKGVPRWCMSCLELHGESPFVKIMKFLPKICWHLGFTEKILLFDPDENYTFSLLIEFAFKVKTPEAA